MTKSHDENNKMQEVANEIRGEFVKIGEEIEQQIMKDYNLVLTKDVNRLRESFNKKLLAENRKYIRRVQSELQKVIKSKSGGNIYGNLLSSTVSPKTFTTDRGSSFGTGGLSQARGQKFVEIGNALAGYQSRNS